MKNDGSHNHFNQNPNFSPLNGSDYSSKFDFIACHLTTANSLYLEQLMI